jgi:Leucine-rich repeat (LRR) protein
MICSSSSAMTKFGLVLALSLLTVSTASDDEDASWRPPPICSLKSNSTVVECKILVNGGTPASTENGGEEPPEHLLSLSGVTGLRLRCDEMASKEDLRPAVFQYLRDVLDAGLEMASAASFPDNSLEHLEVVDCPFRRLQRLDLLFIASSVTSGLKSLTIRNERREVERLLVVEDDAFQDAPRSLASIDLSSNGLLDLDPNLFCPVGRTLSSLNLSHNSLDNLDFVSSCPLDKLHRLDASKNVIRLLKRETFKRTAPRLAEIDLSRNLLSRVEDGVFNGLDGLHVANLAHNALSALSRDIFDKRSQLRELYLSNNSLKVLPSGLLERLRGHLVVLNLSHNAISSSSRWMQDGPFSALSSLVALDLSHNRLANIGSGLLRGLDSLQVLTVAHNQIHSLTRDAFSSTPNLHALVLSHNDIEDFWENGKREGELSGGLSVFAGLERLSSLALDHNRIKVLDR